MSKKDKRIKAALQEFVESEHEKTSDMLDSIEAIHGATARAVVEQCFDMATLFMSMAEVFVLSTDIPEKAKESVVGPAPLVADAKPLTGPSQPRCTSLDCRRTSTQSCYALGVPCSCAKRSMRKLKNNFQNTFHCCTKHIKLPARNKPWRKSRTKTSGDPFGESRRLFLRIHRAGG